MENIKKVAKYISNVLAIINALIIGLGPIWNIPFTDKISNTIAVIIAVIGTYLLGSKAVGKVGNKEEIKTELTQDELLKIYGNIPTVPENVELKPKSHEEGEIDEQNN